LEAIVCSLITPEWFVFCRVAGLVLFGILFKKGLGGAYQLHSDNLCNRVVFGLCISLY